MDVNSSREDIIALLIQLSNQNLRELKFAEEKLKTYESLPGFYSLLLNVVLDYYIDLNTRWQAIIYIKNGIDEHWRRKISSTISEEEKCNLRSRLLCSWNEPANQIATQIAVVIAKIARYDCPQYWPELLPSVLDSVKSENEIVQQRSLLILHHVIKSLSSKRLAGDRRLFQEISSNIFSFILQLWKSHVEKFIQLAAHNHNTLVSTLQNSLLCLKIIRNLITEGFKEPHNVNDVIYFLTIIFAHMQSLLEMRQQFLSFWQLKGILEKYIVLLTKILMDTLDHHPFSFIQFIRPTLEFAVSRVICCENRGMLFEKFIVQCLNLVKGILLCAEYKPSKIIEETKNPLTLEAHKAKSEFFISQVLLEIGHHLVSHYFLLTNEDLLMWEEDPEVFAIEEKGESWKYNLRVCTEVLFVTVFREFREILTPLILDMLEKNEKITHISNSSQILQRDAVYNAVGLTAFDLFDEVDFDKWFMNSLIKELGCHDPPCYKIIRRRVIWLIGQWVVVKLASELRPELYDCILLLLRPEEDLVIRITAAETLKIAIDDFEFNTEQFLPYLEPSFSLLFQLLKQVVGSDTKMHVLHVLSFIVERVGSAIRPHAPALIHYLPLLWEESADHNMLRCAILSAAVHLVEGLGILSQELYPFLVPVIKFSTDVTQEPHIYLLEDGLELWNVTLENSSVLTHDMFYLFSNLMPLLEFGSECLKTCFHIIQAYLLLSPTEIRNTFLPNVIGVCKSLLSDLRAEGVILIMRLLETILKVFPTDGPALCKPILTHICRSIIQNQEYTMVLSMYLAVLSRALINNQGCVMEVVDELAKESNQTTVAVYASLLDVWLAKVTLVTHMERRKVLGLALSCILTPYSHVIYDRFCGILLGTVEIIHDVIRTDDNGTFVDSLILTENDIVYEENEKEHSKRKKQLSLIDPVHSVELRAYLNSQLLQLKQNLGASAFKDLMQTVDVETAQQLFELLKDCDPCLESNF